jgi:hypothetical protein
MIQRDPPTIPERTFGAAGAARFPPQANPDDSAQFGEPMFRRGEASFPLSWRHGGLND